MWTIIKFDPKKINLLKDDLKKKLGKDFIIYRPKLLIQKYKNNKLINKEIALLGNYIFCYHNKFNNHKIICDLKYLRGIKYFLNRVFPTVQEGNSVILLNQQKTMLLWRKPSHHGPANKI